MKKSKLSSPVGIFLHDSFARQYFFNDLYADKVKSMRTMSLPSQDLFLGILLEHAFLQALFLLWRIPD